MKKKLLQKFLFSLSFSILFLGATASLKAQFRDTTIYDYTDYGSGCYICGGDYSCFTSNNQTLVDNSNGKRISQILVKIFHTTCGSGNFYTTLNNDTIGSFTRANSCSCGDCFIDTILADNSVLSGYIHNGNNSISFQGMQLCVDRIMVIRIYSNSAYNDAGIMALDSPAYACPGARNIVTTIGNFGKNQIDSVEVHWTYNGVAQTTYKLISLLDTSGGSGAVKAKITLGSKTLVANKKDTLVIWTSMPNGTADTANLNDTIRKIIAPSLSDTLTVGGTNPMYSTIQGAINALMDQGICKSVVVNIRPGTYNEQLRIGKISGTDSLQTVTFRSSTGDSSDVMIYYASSNSTDNFTLLLNNSQDIIFKEVTLSAQGTSYGTVVEIRGSFLRNVFRNCLIEGTNNSSTSNYNALISNGVINNGTNRNMVFDKCEFKNGSYGIYWSSNINSYNISITNCKFSGQYYMNLYFLYFKNITIHNNDISRTINSYSSGYGIYFEYTPFVKITNNKIIQLNGGSGIYCYSITANNSNRNLIANNFISVGKSDYVNAYAWYSYYSTYTDFYNNNTYSKTIYTGYSNLYIYYGNNIRVRNNSIFQSSPGNIVYQYGSNNIEKCENNNYFSDASTYSFNSNSVTYNSLDDWKVATKNDSFSTWSNPNYKSTSNLHLYSADLNGHAIPDNRITKDIDGQTRNSSKPDIGADEFDLAPIDAGISRILAFKSDSVCIEVVIKNNGADTLKNSQIGWTINGSSQTSYSWSGAIPSGETDTVCIGKYKFIKATNYNVKAWTSQPNGIADTLNFNDTSKRIGNPALSGTYTIGGSSPDFSTFNTAVSAMISDGIIDSVKFKVRNGTYSERVEIPKIAGANALNSIIIESENNNPALVTLSYATNSTYLEVLSLKAARGVSIRNITIKSTNASPSRAVTLLNGASNIELLGNRLESKSNNSTDLSYNSVVYCNNPGNNIRMRNNQIANGTSGIYINQTSDVLIQGNTFENAYYMGIYIDNVTNLELKSNTITSNTAYSSYYTTYIYYLYGNNSISNNRFIGPNKSEYTGLQIYYISPVKITDSTYIFNNFISTGGNNAQYSLYIYNCQNTYIAHNNINNYSTRSGTINSAFFYNINNSEVYNNNFICDGNGIPLNIDNPSMAINDYNNYYTNGSYLSRLNYTSYSSIAALKANTLDSHSLNINPLFNSNIDLHNQNVALNETAKKLHFVNNDIDNEVRDSFIPDIGGDEIEPVNIDAGVVAFISPNNILKTDTTFIKVAVRNLGLGNLYSVKVKCKINNDTLPMVSYNDTLFPGDSIHLILGKYSFKRDSINNLTAWTVLPNATSDQKTSNDTFRILNRKTSMSGVYTIGGSSPDFPTFKAALNAMYVTGISGGVRFRVRAGTYSEQLRILPIPGADSKNSVIFESSNLDSTSVILQYNSIYSDSNYVVFFNGCTGITFRNMTIKALGTTYSVVFLFENKAQYNILTNNYILGYTINTTSTRYSVIASFNSTYSDDYNEICNNVIEGGSYGMYWYGYGSPNYSEYGTVIRNNHFKNQYNRSLYLYYQTNIQVDKNIFTTSASYASYYPIYGYYLRNKTRITANIITSNFGSNGIYVYNSNGNSDTILIANNVINMNGSSTSTGIMVEYPYYTHIVNNTIRIATTATSSSKGIYIYYGDFYQILNNIIENSSAGYCMYLPSVSNSNSDYNNLRTAGSNMIYWNSTNYSTLAAFTAGTKNDSHSLSLDPLFMSPTNFHVRQIGFNTKAIPHPLVKVDIDGELRNDTMPDIGADEFNPPAIDASVVEFANLNNGLKPDTLDLRVVVRNLGTSALNSYNVHCKINRDSFNTVYVTDTLASGDTAQILVGSYEFKKDSINNLTAWTSAPNGTNDQNSLNDTFRIINKKTSMSGVYTIGGSSPDFTTFKAAINAMNLVGIVDNVRFRVRAGTYTERLLIQAISGAGIPNSVIFESSNLDSTSVVLQANATSVDSNYVVYFNGASGITFRNMTIKSLGTSYSRVFVYENKSRYNCLKNNYIKGPTSAQTSTYNAIIGSFNSTLSDDYNEFSNNLIEGGSYGMYWYGYGAPNNQENGTLIRNNYFKNQYYMGLQVYYQDNVIIDRNIFTSSSTYSSHYNIYGYYLRFKTRITSNQITNNSNGYGIYQYNSSNSGDTTLIANNVINLGGTGNPYGINLEYPYNAHIVYNTIRIASTTNSSANGIYIYSGNYNQLNNNIIENLGPSKCLYIYSSSSINKSDRNNYRTAGTYLAYWNGTNYTTLAALQAATLRDSNSLSIDPLFYSSSNFHIRQINLNGKASPHPLVKIDIDGDTRNSSTPDIGADEFNPPAIDAAVTEFANPNNAIKPDTTLIRVVVRNFGTSALNSYKVYCKINKDTFIAVVSDTLASGDSAQIYMGKYLFKRDSINNLIAWTFAPNGGADGNSTNDTFRIINRKTRMSGVYTIGGSNPDFNSFKAAIKEMNNVGIIDNVHFKVRSGTYTEQLRFIPISGAGAPNSIIFESEDLDSTLVTLQFNSVFYDSNYVVFFNGASGITFRKMRIRSLNASYSVVFLYENKAQNNILSNNYIVGNGGASTSSYNAVIGSFNSSYSDDLNTFTNNLIEGGSFGMYWYGYGAPNNKENKTVVQNNHFKDQYYMGLYMHYQTNSLIDHNTFSSTSAYTYYYGIYCNYSYNKSRFTSNKINMGNNGGYGIYLYGCDGSGDTILIANNMITMGGTNTAYNIYCNSSNNLHIVNNTLKLTSTTNNSSAGLYFNSGSNNEIHNNIFENEGLGYCFDIPSSSAITKSNRNNFRTAGTNLARWNGVDYTTLNALKTASSKDVNSLTFDPMFLSSSNLHIRQIGLNAKASVHPMVKLDIDGALRNTTTPDIGADEFNPPQIDAGIFDIILPKTPFPRDSQFVVVALKNYGLNTLTSVKIDWILNKITQSTFNWTGNLASNDSIHVKLAKKFFNSDSAYSMKVWTSIPNNYTDNENYNDTAKVINQYPALSGVYTIGGASPDFNTFTEAIDAMKLGGIIGTVTFNVRNGTYSEKLILPKIVGAEKRNSIVFQSENLDSTKVTLINSFNTSSNNYTLWMQGTKGVTFKHMTISATNTSYGVVVYLTDGSTMNTFTNTVLEGVSTTGTGANMAVIYSTITNNYNNHNNHFTNNMIRNGSYGLYGYGYANGFTDKNILIRNNTFQNPYYTGIYLSYNDTLSIINNKITVGTQTNAFGIRMEYCYKSYRILNNSIVVPNGYMGLYMYGADGLTTKYSQISNNMISVLGNGNNYGIYGYSTSYVNLYNNNIYVNSTSSSSYATMIYGSNVRSVNNIFYHSGAGYAFYNNSSSFNECNYNCYKSNGSYLAYWNGNITTLSALQSANSMDAKSISEDPNFVSETDLHSRAIPLDKAGKPLTDIKTDFDGQLRNSIKPDIGADEFDIPSPNDAGISAYVGPLPPFSNGSNSIKVTLNNYGSDTLKSSTIKWTMNGTAQTNYNWTGKIVSGGSATITIGTFNFSNSVNYTLVAWPTIPNGEDDTIYYNDTLKKINIYSGLHGTYTIGGYLPDFKSFAEANLALMQRGVIDSVLFNVRNGTYQESLVILPYPGSSPTRPVTFASESGDSSKVILQYNPSTSVLLHIKGADNITFSRLTLRCYGGYYYNNTVLIDNEARNTVLTNNRIIADPPYYKYYGYYGTAITSGSDKDDSTKILYNYISGDNGIQLFGSGTNSNQQEVGLLIEGNKLDLLAQFGIRVQYMNAPIIRRNSITADNNYGPYLMYMSNNYDKTIISHNKLNGYNSSAVGMYIGSQIGTSTKNVNIFNNFVTLQSSASYGIQIYNSTYCNLYYNSVNIYGNSNSASKNLLLSSNTNLDLKNNILFNNASGYSIFSDNVPSICNYNDIYTTGTNLVSINNTNYANLASWKAATSRDLNSKSVDPTFFSNTDLHTTLVNLDSAATPITSVSDDIDGNTRNTNFPDIGADEFNSLPNNLSITTILNPVSGCMIDSQQLRVTIFNYGSFMQKNFPVKYRINNGTIYTQNFTDSIFPGTSKTFSFTGKVDTKNPNNYHFKVWTDLSTEQYRLNDTIKSLIINYNLPDSIKTMSPKDSIKNLAYPISFSWTPPLGATLYDVYIWPDTANRPSTPSYYNLTQIGIQIPNGLIYGQTYKWQVYAKNPSCGTFGKVQIFTVRELPDLIVTSISSPSTAFSGTNISASWIIKNTGKGTTGTSSWYDLVYLSNDQVLDVLDPIVAGVINATSLTPGSSYNNSVTLNLPNGIVGKYYLLVRTEAYNQFIESNEGNNIRSDSAGMTVTLTPPPDLRVISVIKPKTAFSGENINIQYTITNKGTGTTRTNSWMDQIFLNDDSTIGGTWLKNISHNGVLDVDSSYKVNTTIALPFNLSGGYYVIVKTDVNNQEFEHAAENNNDRISDSIKIIQTPPPDLIVRNIKIKDTSSNKEIVNLTYDLINQGGSATTHNWTDYVFISRFSTFSTGTSELLTTFGRSNIKKDDTLVASQNITIPDNLNGLFYLYIYTDYHNNQFEGVNDTNNLSARKPFRIMSPDLIISSVNIPTADTSGKYIKIDWKVKNNGIGKNISGIRQDNIYISRHSSYHKDSVQLIDSVQYFTNLNPNDIILKTRYSRIPNGTYGNRYVYVYTDVRNQIYENGMDTNNYRRSDLIDITLAPYPDLRTILLTVPDTSEAGTMISVGYTVENKGIKIANPKWNDKIFISKDSVYNPSKIVLLQTNTVKDSLHIDSAYEYNQSIMMPNHISAGDYYFFAYTDANDALYEFKFEKNNFKRSPKVYIKGYPPIDLTVTSSTIPDTIYSGTSGNFGYTVKNIGDVKTFVNGWEDNVYISKDTFIDPTDLSIGKVPIFTTLDKDDEYSRNLSFLVPNGFSGDYYVFFGTDWKKDNIDEDTINNIQIARNAIGKPKKMKIELSLSSDLQLAAWDVPSTVIAGQPATFSWKVENKGDTTTKAGNWIDAVYLSTDYTIDASDILLGNSSHSGNLKKGSFYNKSENFYFPSNISGNRIIIIKTDNANREYEHMAENNNIGTSAITVNIAPPGDLVVNSVYAPSTAAAGSNVTVTYVVSNVGANPISGYRTDNIYLSTDSELDGTDILFATYVDNASIIPNGRKNMSISGSIKGIKTGNYRFIVFTDVKNNISESKDTNNTDFSDLIDISIPELPLNVLTLDSIFKNKELYYRLVIPDDLEGESFIITLKGDSINGNNEIYAKYEEVPTRSDFDIGFLVPFFGNQEIIIPAAKKGTYYLMVYGKTTTSPKQYITLLAKKMIFEIRKINPKKGGNNGQVTLRIDGGKFDSLTTFSLSNGVSILNPEEPDTLSRMYSQSKQSSKYNLIINPTLAYVTFDLRGKDIGDYDVIASKDDGNETATLTKGFKVVAGGPPDIEVSVQAPSSTRANTLTSFLVMFNNSGNTDMVNGFLEIVSNGGAPISLTIDGLKDKTTSIFLPLEEYGGIKNLLSPGGLGTITIYTYSNNALAFNIVIPQ